MALKRYMLCCDCGKKIHVDILCPGATKRCPKPRPRVGRSCGCRERRGPVTCGSDGFVKVNGRAVANSIDLSPPTLRSITVGRGPWIMDQAGIRTQ